MTASKNGNGEIPDCKQWSSGPFYNQHPSLRKLTPIEKKFLLAVEHGDAATVNRMLSIVSKDHTLQLDVNCKDPVGRSALLMAIDNENLEMLEILLENGVECRDALLHAINAEYVEAVELLLDHEEIIHKKGESHSWEKVERDISSFTSEITPLILAAHKDNYEILKILLDRGATLPMPHDVRCRCSECVQAMEEDCLCHSRSRINAYRALSSPSLICLSSIDPILTAFELSWELRRLSLAENEFKEDYQKLRFRCQDFATSLLAQTRSSEELGVILSHDPTRLPTQENDVIMSLTRVEMAIKYKQKKFIAHPSVQQLLSTLWYDGLPGFRRLNSIQQAWELLKIGVLFPLYTCLYMLFPASEKSKVIRKPFFKFIMHSFSYLFFLFLLILASQRVETVLVQLFGTESMKLELMESLKKQRGQLPTVIETSILLFIIAHIWQETRELWRKGLVEYCKNMWNLIDFTRNCLHVGTALLRVLAYFQAQSEIQSNPMAVYIPREAWDAFDPMLIADGLFAAGNVFAALKLVHIFSINPYLGPLQISLGRMVIDIIKFFFIYSLVLFAFACGLNQLLWYYADREKQQCFTGPGGTENWVTQRDSCLAWRRFSNLFESSQTLFWASFGLVDISDFELSGIKSYTRFWGLLMFGSYSVINVVVLLNLLIAMMSNSYQIISERADEEWKFARTMLFMNYFEEGGTIPPPFNIFPTVKNIKRFFTKNQHPSKNMSIETKESQMKERDTVYQSVMCNLVWRYVTAQQKACEADPVTEDEIKELRQDISSFRHDIMHVLRCNGMNTKDINMDKINVSPGKKIQVRERRLIKDFSIGLMEVCADDAAPEIKGNKGVLARLVGHNETASSRWRDLIQLAKKSQIIESKQTSGINSSDEDHRRQDDATTNETEQITNTKISDSTLKNEKDSNNIQKDVVANQMPISTIIQEGETRKQDNFPNSEKLALSTEKIQKTSSKLPSSPPSIPMEETKKRQSPPLPPPKATNTTSNKAEKVIKTKVVDMQIAPPPPVVEIPVPKKIKAAAPQVPLDPKNQTTSEMNGPTTEHATMINVQPSPKKTVINMDQEKQDDTSALIDLSEKDTALEAINVSALNAMEPERQSILLSDNGPPIDKPYSTKTSSLITVSGMVAKTNAENPSPLQTAVEVPAMRNEKVGVCGTESVEKILSPKVCQKKETQTHGWL